MSLGLDGNQHVVIVGGGIAGLSAAYYLQKAAETRSLPIRYTLIERSERLGGKIITDLIHDYGDQPFIVEGGPDSFVTQKPYAQQLASELKMDGRLLGTNDAKRKTYVLNKGRPAPHRAHPLLAFCLLNPDFPVGKAAHGYGPFHPAQA